MTDQPNPPQRLSEEHVAAIHSIAIRELDEWKAEQERDPRLGGHRTSLWTTDVILAFSELRWWRAQSKASDQVREARDSGGSLGFGRIA